MYSLSKHAHLLLSFFEKSGVEVDNYTLCLDEGTHSALHYGGGPVRGGDWWNICWCSVYALNEKGEPVLVLSDEAA